MAPALPAHTGWPPGHFPMTSMRSHSREVLSPDDQRFLRRLRVALQGVGCANPLSGQDKVRSTEIPHAAVHRHSTRT